MNKLALVVDDNPPIRKMVATAFSAYGFCACVEAENGQQAIELAQKLDPDLISIITLDLSMPVMDGLTAAPMLRKLLPKSSIVLFTLYADDISPTEASKLGIDRVLSKIGPLTDLLDTAMLDM